MLILVGVVAAAQVGTQPGALATLPDSPAACSCHYDPQPGVVVEPGQTHAATPMALATLDPFFRAAFVVAREDRPELTDLCLRCHAPRGWLAGRGGADLEALSEDDATGVGCDVCHRQVLEDPPVVGNARLTISDTTAKRSQRGAEPFGGHGVIRSDDPGRSEACASCHSLFNPTEDAHDALGRNLGFPYYEQRTYEEWVASVFPGQGETCIDCHMSVSSGRAVDGGETYPDLRRHDIVGANDLVARAVQFLNPSAGLSGLIPNLQRQTEESLRRAAELSWTRVPDAVGVGEPLEVQVRLENRTGHKLPTGYPEGRRVYLEVALERRGEIEVLIGRWDPAVGDLVADPQLVTYETVHGRVEGGRSEVTHHLLLMNQVRVDSRIPPEGFVPPFEDMVPVGRDFGAAAPYRHFDEPSFSLRLPADVMPGTELVLRVRAMFQVAHGEAVDFLIDETRSHPEGEALARAWQALDRAPPREMARVEHTLRVIAPAAADAGVAVDGGREGPVTMPELPAEGCRGQPGGGGIFALLVLVLVLPPRRRA